MDKQMTSAEKQLYALFHGFIEAGLHGKFSDALSLIRDPYLGVGMGEQGVVKSKAELEVLLQGSYIPTDDTEIDLEIKDFAVNFISEDVASMVGEVAITNTPKGGKSIRAGLIQSICAYRKDDEWKISFTHSSPISLTVESVEAYPIRFLDNTLSELKKDLRIASSSNRDALTGILNREGFDKCVVKLMEDYIPNYNTALFMIDLDDFKQINDRLGHQVGDIVLQQLAKVLEHTFKDSDAVARVGGDEFMVFLRGNFTSKFLEKKASEILSSMNLNMSDNHQVPVSVSVGVAYGRARIAFEKLYRISDIALYSAKKAGKCRYHLINSDTNTQHSYSGASANILSLQTLLEYTSGKEFLETKTPYEALLENIPGGVVIFELTDKELRRTHCNDWFTHLLGYTEDEVNELQADNPLVLIHPDDAPEVDSAIKAIRSGLDSCNLIYRARCKDGRYIYINEIVTVTERRSNSTILYGIECDIDELMRLRQQVGYSNREDDTPSLNS